MPRNPGSPFYGAADDELAQVWAWLDVREGARLAQLSKQAARVSALGLGLALQLAPEQVRCFLDAMRGESIFVTGGAGCGKSHTIGTIVQHLRPGSFTVASSTGCSAALIGAATLHSVLGLGIGGRTPADCASRLRGQKESYARLKQVRTLIVDECSMLDGATFDRAGEVMAIVRGKVLPMVLWGDVQVIVVGDLMQLPPVEVDSKRWVFDSAAWKALAPKVHILTHVHRQSGDPQFADVLARVRVGTTTAADVEYLKANSAPQPTAEALQLFARNEPADQLNAQRFKALLARGKRAYRFCAIDSGSKQQLLDKCPAPKELFLCEGARVMCLRNLISGQLTNGTTGTVKAVTSVVDPGYAGTQTVTGATVTVTFDGLVGDAPFDYEFRTYSPGAARADAVHYEFTTMDGEKLLAQRIQLPIRLAWAVSIHKAQGCSLERVSIDFAGIFSVGQGYVALSRCKTLAGIHLKGLQLRHLRMASARALRWYEEQARMVRDALHSAARA